MRTAIIVSVLGSTLMTAIGCNRKELPEAAPSIPSALPPAGSVVLVTDSKQREAAVLKYVRLEVVIAE